MLLHGPGDTYYLRANAVAGDLVTESIDNIVWMKCDRATTGFIPDRVLFSKTGNNLGAFSGRLRRSGMVWGLADSVSGTNLVQIEFAERAVARGCVGLLLASFFEFGRTAGNSVLAAA